MKLLAFYALPLAALIFSGCTSSRDSSGADPRTLALIPRTMAAAKPSGKIRHVVIIVQENRSLDNLFQGYPGADTVSTGIDSKGQTIALRAVGLRRRYDIDHDVTSFFQACDGTGSLPGTDCRNDGFDREALIEGPPNGQFVYVPHKESKPYFDIAREFVLADKMFTSQVDESFVAHQYLIAGRAEHAVNIPNGPWGCDGGKLDIVLTLTDNRSLGKAEAPCFDYRTLGDELDEAGLSWRFYTSKYGGDPGGVWSAYQAVRHIRFSRDWSKNIITPQKQFLDDVSNGKLAAVTWITPTCTNSDHPFCGGGTGPSWVASLVNAIGESKFWNSTAVFVLWDDWGGFYDHVPPPLADFDGLGFRVPFLIVSPYAKQNYVSHVQYETASVLRFTEDQFGLGRLAVSDRRATSPEADCFDFSQAPRTFIPITAPFDRTFFSRQPLDDRIPDGG